MRFIILFFLLTFSLSGFTAGVQSDDFKIGKPGSSANKRLQFGISGELRYNTTDSKLQFSNNGTDFKNIGSGGSSGGDNLLVDDNPDFEGGTTGWTLTGAGTFSAETTAPLNGLKSAKFNASASGEKVCSALKLIKGGYQGRACQVDLPFYQYASGSAGDYELNVYNGEGVEIATFPLAVTGSTATARAFQSFDCPALNGGDDSDQLQMCVDSTADGGDILWDDAFLGQGRNEVSTSQTTLVAHAYYSNAPSCQWNRTNTSFGDFSDDTDCPAITVAQSTQAVNAADNDQPDLQFSSLSPGKYIVETAFHGQASDSGATAGYRISIEGAATRLGAGDAECGFTTVAATERMWVTCSASFEVTTAGAVGLVMQGFSSAGSVSINGNSDSASLSFKVWKVPANAAEAITLETIGEYWDVNIGGAHVDLGASNQTSYVGMENAGLDMVVNPNSKTAEIPCSGTNPSSGLTCAAGNESVGIAFTISAAGRYKACATFSHNASGDNTGFVNAAFQLVETPNNAQTILQQGNDRPTSSPDNGTGASIATTSAHYTCSYFHFASTGKKTIRLFYEQQVAATISSNSILADRSASIGQRDIHIVVTKEGQQSPTPVFTDLTTSLNQKISSGVNGVRNYVFQINCDAGSAILADPASVVSSVGNVSGGVCTVTLNSGKFAVTPICFSQEIGNSNPNKFLRAEGGSSTSVTLDCDVDGGADCTSYDVSVMCQGT